MVATKDEIIVELNKVRAKLMEEKMAKEFKNWNKTMQYYFTDSNDYWHIKVVNGMPDEAVQSKVDKPEISYQMTTDTFLDLMRGKITGMKAYSTGKLKIKASMPDIIKLQKLE